jgi:NAD(P)-dependent dehydrogenase (short-subunit alcohol dehydrogenase family)
MINMKTNKIPTNKVKRMINWGWRQKAKTITCPDQPRLDNKIVVITGGNTGIGLETVKGLLQRGAEVIMTSRNKSKSIDIMKSLEGKVHFVELDLGDLDTFTPAIKEIETILAGRTIDTLILNAGIGANYPYRQSPQGFELTFAVNVLGHHVLFRILDSNGSLTYNAHVISITGDLYFQADNCTPDFKYTGNMSMDAYARSKVGVMWWGLQCHKLYTNYKVNLIHPGVVPMGLGANQNSILRRIMSVILLSPQGGAQTTLYCATQPDIENGAYYHNTMGKAVLPENDIALDIRSSLKLWFTLEDIYNSYFKKIKDEKNIF